MPLYDNEGEVLTKLLEWSIAEPLIRAVIHTSSRTRPDGVADRMSDYDIVLVVTKPDRFKQDKEWQSVFGTPMVGWGDEGELLGTPTLFCGVVYDDYTKIDYTIWHVELLEKIAQQPQMPPCLDVGYRVLLDKDGGTTSWKPPTYKAHIPAVPTATEYRLTIEEFWWSTTYFAKSLWRDDLVFARWIFENEIRVGTLRVLLEWHIEIAQGWSVKPGVWGRGLKRWLSPDVWAEIESTYVGVGIEENWQALWRIITLFHRIAVEVGNALGYTYPQEIEERMLGYLREIQDLPK